MAKKPKIGADIPLPGVTQKKLVKDMNAVLQKHGVAGHLKEFKVTTMESAGGCPPGTTWGCRFVGGAIICRCWPG